MTQNQHRLGIILTASAALCWSLSGIFTRGISAELFTMLFWRGLASGTFVFAAFFIMEGNGALTALKKFGWTSLAVGLFSAGSMICGIGSFRYGSVADSMVIYATAPFISAGLAFLVIGERPSRSTMIASGLALVGVVIMMLGQSSNGTWFGRVLAIFMTLFMACFAVLLRKNKGVPMLPAMGCSAYFAAFFSFWMAQTLAVTRFDGLMILAFGVIQNGAGLIFYTLGSRRIPAAEATLLAALEVPLAPLWVYLVFSETPGIYTLVGGAIVMLALIGHIVNGRREPQGM